MLSSSPAKIHEPLAVGVSPRPTGRQNCETRGVAEATGLVDLTGRPAGTRLILRKERPHPGGAAAHDRCRRDADHRVPHITAWRFFRLKSSRGVGG
jgi:hypothetical protein